MLNDLVYHLVAKCELGVVAQPKDTFTPQQQAWPMLCLICHLLPTLPWATTSSTLHGTQPYVASTFQQHHRHQDHIAWRTITNWPKHKHQHSTSASHHPLNKYSQYWHAHALCKWVSTTSTTKPHTVTGRALGGTISLFLVFILQLQLTFLPYLMFSVSEGDIQYFFSGMHFTVLI